METTLFLGAGASMFAKMPTTKKLIADVLCRVSHHEKWNSRLAHNLAIRTVHRHADKDVEVLYKTIQDMISAEELHKEVVENKTSQDGARWLSTRGTATGDKSTREPDDIDENINTLKSLKVAIRNTLLTSLMVKPKYVDDVASTYDALFQHVPRNVLTTNYDNVLETYCEQKKIGLVNGFGRSHLGDRRMWGGDKRAQGGAWRGGKDALRLVKLHGSITWQKGDGGVLEIGRPGLRDPTGDVMIVPTLGEKDYTRDIFPDMLNRFKMVLTKTELLIVVGFSFRDLGINRMFRRRLTRSVGNPRPMRLLYVGPKDEDDDKDDVKKFVGGKDEPREVRGHSCVLLDYSRGDMPYVYAYREKFEDAAKYMNLVLDDLDAACKAPLTD